MRIWRVLHSHKSIDVTYISEDAEALGSGANCMHAASALDVSCLDLQDTSTIWPQPVSKVHVSSLGSNVELQYIVQAQCSK